MSYPADLPEYDPFTTPITLQAFQHSDRHLQMQNDIIALATKVGTDASDDPNSLEKRLSDVEDWMALVDVQLGTIESDILAVDGRVDDIIDGTEALSTPQILNFTGAQHDHEDAAGGGKIGTLGLLANAATKITEVVQVVGTPGSVAAASGFVTIASGSFTSQHGGDLLVLATYSNWKASNLGETRFRIQIGSTNVPNSTGWPFYWNTLLEHQSHSFMAVVSGVPAGTYTCNMQESTVANSLDRDAMDVYTLVIVELKR